MALGLLADAALVVLLIAISGFIFEGPEGANGAASAVAGWGMSLAVCVLSPLMGLMMWRRGRRDLSLVMGWLPPLAMLVGAVVAR